MTIPNEIDDARNIYNYIFDLKNIGDVSFLGHSQGGVVAAMLAGELGAEKIKSLVLMAPAAIYKDQAQNGNTLGINFDPGNIPEYITAFNHKIGRDYLKTAQDLPIYDMSEKYTGPVCIIQGKKDENVPFSEAESFCKIYKNCHLHLLDDENHFFKINPDKAINIAVDFLKDTI